MDCSFNHGYGLSQSCDSRNNRIRQVQFENGQPVYILERIIEYYEQD